MKFKSIKVNFLLVELLVLILFNILLLNFPLSNTLGFEFTILNGILISFLSGLLYIHNQKLFDKEKQTFGDILASIKKGNLLFLVIPILISFISLLFVKNCAILQGIMFYLFITGPSVIVGTGLSSFSCLLSRKYPYSFFIIIYFIVLISPVFEIYFYPHIFFYNPILTYYPGTIYDESIPVDFNLISYRILNVIYFGIIILVSFKYQYSIENKKINYRIAIILVILLTAIVFVSLKDELGYSVTLTKINSELKESIETEHFIIYYDGKINKKEIELLALSHEYYFFEVSNYLNEKPSQKITSFIFVNSGQKKRLLGSEAADVAKPWLNYIYINYENYQNTLKHEIVHCIAAGFGVTPFKIAHNFNPALTEGIATAADGEYSFNTIHYAAGLAYNNNFRYPIESLFKGLNFFGQLSSLSYVYSGSFCKYLIDEYGVEKFKMIFQNGSFESVYGKSIRTLEKEYYLFIESFGIGNIHQATYYFGRKPIIRKECPRFLAEQNSNAWEAFNSKDFNVASKKFLNLLNYTDSYIALNGYIRCLIEMEKYNKALMVINKNINKYYNTSYTYNLEYLHAEVLGLSRNFEKADSLYNLIEVHSPSWQFKYLSNFRREIINDTTLYLNYCKGSNFDRYLLIHELNKDHLKPSSIPIMIELSKELNENYSLFIKQLDKPIDGNSDMNSFAFHLLSQMALNNADYSKAIEYGYASLQFAADKNFRSILTSHLEKTIWFEKFAKAIKMSFIWRSNN